jgi:hypothetical protein
LDARFNHIQWASNHASHSTGSGCRQDFQAQPNISLSDPLLRQVLLLFVECELQR